MNGIPARLAGVRDIAMITPPREDGRVNPYLLAAAREVGVNRVHKAGSAWAIGALAYGTASIAPVDVIVGPGNIYVALAKKMVAGEVESTSSPDRARFSSSRTRARGGIHCGGSPLSQAEHDPMASAVCIATSRELAVRVFGKDQGSKLALLPRRQTAQAAARSYGAVFVASGLEDAVPARQTA